MYVCMFAKMYVCMHVCMILVGIIRPVLEEKVKINVCEICITKDKMYVCMYDTSIR